MSGCTDDVIDRNLDFMSIRPALDSRNYEAEIVKGLCKKAYEIIVRQQAAHEPAACPGTK